MEPNQQSTTPEQQALEHEVLTPQLIKDLIDLLKDPKPQVQHQTLNVVLQYTTLSESKQKFKDTNIIQLLIKNVFNQRLTTVCLSNMINLSSQECFYDKFAGIIEPLTIQMQSWKDLMLELASLLLINLSKIEQCADVIIGKEDKEGYCLNILFGFLKTPKIGSYIANIASNVTSFESGRKLFAKSCIPLDLKEFIFSSEREKRLGVVKTIRNTLFEWENEQFIAKLLDQKHNFINDFILYWIFLLQSSTHLIKDTYDYSKILEFMSPLLPYQHKFDAASHYREKELEEVTLSVELLLILTNVDFNTLKPVYKKEEFKEALALLSRIEQTEEEKDKLEALNVFFC